MRFMLYEERFTSVVMIRFLRRLIQGPNGQKLFLILDNLKVYPANKVKEWVEARPEQIELFFLSAYSLGLNPDEYLNCDLKVQVHSGKATRNKKELKKQVYKTMHFLKNQPEWIKQYFRHSKY